jgi:hypothetical protein
MIGLEALLSDGNQEMTHKIAMRVAALYKLHSPATSFTAFRELKKIYEFRSKVVHGSADLDINASMARGDATIQIVDAAIEHLRFALNALVRHPQYIEVGRIDRELLIGEMLQGT